MENYSVGKSSLRNYGFSMHLEIFHRIVECTQVSPQANIIEIVPGWRENSNSNKLSIY